MNDLVYEQTRNDDLTWKIRAEDLTHRFHGYGLLNEDRDWQFIIDAITELAIDARLGGEEVMAEKFMNGVPTVRIALHIARSSIAAIQKDNPDNRKIQALAANALYPLDIAIKQIDALRKPMQPK